VNSHAPSRASRISSSCVAVLDGDERGNRARHSAGDNPDRVGAVRQLGVDETSFLRANPEHSTVYATGLVDLRERIVIDMVKGNAAADLRRWTAQADPRWLAGIEVVATELAESFRAGRSPHLDHATRVADPFHVVRVANRCLDKVRRRVQNETLGHRGRKADPLYRIRKLLLSGAERLDERGNQRMLLGLRVGDPHDEALGAWLARERARRVPHRRSERRRAPPRQGHHRLRQRRRRQDPVARSHARRVAHRDPCSPQDWRVERADRGSEPVREER
jgi:transposase